MADEIRSRILETKGNIAIARASPQVHDGPSSSSSHTTGQSVNVHNPSSVASDQSSDQDGGSSPATVAEQNHHLENESSPSLPAQSEIQDGGSSSHVAGQNMHLENESPLNIPAVPISSIHSQATPTKTRLPKLVLPKFNGEITKFTSFWDSFDSAVNKNVELSPVDKFNYLHALLEGPAARAIQGLTLSESNYKAAVDILHERFGKTQQIISAHMDDLLRLPNVIGDKPGQLRVVYVKIKVNVRGLESLGVGADQYGSFLIPVIMSKLPVDVRLHIARVSTKDVWEIKELLEVIRREVDAREMSETMKVHDKKGTDMIHGHTSKKSHPQYTASSLVVKSGIHCAFCKGDHYSSACEEVKDVQKRKDILRRENRCFLCLSKGHRASQCSSQRKCRRCGRNNHHQSICETNPYQARSETPIVTSSFQPNPSSMSSPSAESLDGVTTTSTARSNVKVLLQTARTYAYSENGSELVPVRVLLDSGSQRSYVTNDLKNKLGLKTLKSETLNLNTL